MLNQAGLPSLNHLTFRAAAVEAWRMANNGALGNIFQELSVTGRTRSATAGLLNIPTAHSNNIGVRNISVVWNGYPEIREAKTIHDVKRIAQRLSQTLPI